MLVRFTSDDDDNDPCSKEQHQERGFILHYSAGAQYRICQSISIYFSPFAKQHQAKVLPRFQSFSSFCIELKVLNESKHSMPWVCCPFFLFDDTIQIKMITLMLLILMVIMIMKMMILMVIEIMTTAPSVLHQLKFGWKCFKLLRRSPLSAQRVHFNGYVNTDRVVMKSCILRLEALSLESILPLKLLLHLITNKKNSQTQFPSHTVIQN